MRPTNTAEEQQVGDTAASCQSENSGLEMIMSPNDVNNNVEREEDLEGEISLQTLEVQPEFHEFDAV